MIEACYAFPGGFPLAVIARNDQAVVDAVMAAVTADGRELRSHQRQESSGGKYVSHRLEVRVGSATEAQRDFKLRGGNVIIRRLTSPRAT